MMNNGLGGWGWSGGNGVMFHGHTVVVADSCTDTNGTAVASHTPEVNTAGGGWTANTGTWTIQSNKISHDATAAAVASIAAGIADFVRIEADIVPEGTNSLAGICIRHSDASNFWLCRWRHGASDRVEIAEMNAGTPTLRASAALVPTADGEAYSIVITASGTTITATVNGTTATYASATFNQSATRIGVVGGTATGATFDNLRAT